MTTSSMTLTRSDLSTSLELVEIKPGKKFSKQILIDMLPDVETLLFFAKLYALDAGQLGNLLRIVLDTPLVQALTGGDHSTDLQDYLVDIAAQVPGVSKGSISFDPKVPKGEILPELWKMCEVEIAKSIQAVADKLGDVVNHLPGKQGQMLFKSLSVVNARRPTIGDHRAIIHHPTRAENLVILDVSGSMTEPTVRALVEDVVAMSYMADAHLAVVSNTVTHWEPGAFDTLAVLSAAEYGGTYYERLYPLFQNRDWGTVVTVADYDSSESAYIKLGKCHGRVGEVLDISLVNRPTYLSECVGQLASKVRPLLIASTSHVIH